ncbi:MAG TPA: VTT domain-containing protein [Xanthobacteraceae bacterium]|nr:VTT domain-containing protein [Xanthobacteraceae bacterium]
MILAPNRNIWRLERAGRAALLIDGASYFGALREALLKARSTVFIIGWDLDSRTRLVDESGHANDGYPEGFADFLTVLVNERPQLTVHLLVWDYSVLYALEREPFPTISLGWRTPRRIRFCLDEDLPAGAAHHQKIVVVDDAVAFCGGLDITIRRWDTAEHRLDDARRVDPAGVPYRPFHDVQAVVDGAAARALAELARERWMRGACERTPPVRPTGDPWPSRVKPDFGEIDVGIARTLPASEKTQEVREVEALFFDAIDRASRTIYIENQFLTADRLAHHLAKRMQQQPELEVLLVAPKAHDSWLEAHIMRAGRVRFMEIIKAARVADRAALLCPYVSAGDHSIDVMVHSKVMVVDDVLLRVGSANLNNRSIGFDTECDLAIEAKTHEERRTVAHMRNRLLGHHCGVSPVEVAAALVRTRSLIESARTLTGNGHSLQPVDDSGVEPSSMPALQSLADPERPIPPPTFLQTFVGKRPRARRLGRLANVIGTGVLILGLILAWRFTPLSALAHPDSIRQWLVDIAEIPAAPLIVLATFVLGGLVVFPVMLLIAATAAAFGPWLGFVLAGMGAIASAVITYGIGAAIGRDAVETVMGPRLHRVRRSIRERGVLAVAAIRLVPIAPFTLVNLIAGASKIRFTDYVLGTVIGMAPGLVLMSALGHRIWSIISEPTLTNIVLFVLAVLAWLVVSIGAQALMLHWRRRST